MKQRGLFETKKHYLTCNIFIKTVYVRFSFETSVAEQQ